MTTKTIEAQAELVPFKKCDTVAVAGTSAPVGVYDLLMRSVSDPGSDPAKLRELLAVRREWNADEAAAAFNAAVVTFQQRCPIIPKLDKAYDKYYARMDRIWRMIRPLLETCGLAVTWESVRTEKEVCFLEGHLRHSRGHAQPLHHEVPVPELIKGQNAAQRAGSAETYAKRYATCAALGIQVGDDDDGAGGVSGDCITDEQARELRGMAQATGTKEDVLCQAYGVRVIEAVPASMYAAVKAILNRKMDRGLK
jgi:hypothetical protein